MKKLVTTLSVIALLLGWLPAAHASPVVVLNVGDTVSINGQLYVVGVSLLPVPTTTPVVVPPATPPVTPPVTQPVPPPVTPPVVGALSITGYRDASRNWLAGSTPVAVEKSTLFIEGVGFGAIAGTVTYGATQSVTVVKWTDTEITIIVPNAVAGVTAAQTVDVRRSGTDNAHLVDMGFAIKAAS